MHICAFGVFMGEGERYDEDEEDLYRLTWPDYQSPPRIVCPEIKHGCLITGRTMTRVTKTPIL